MSAGATSARRADLAAGITTAMVLVPQAMGYAMIAGLPPIAGLHGALVGLVVYAALGRSSALAIGPVAMDSLLTGVALASVPDLPIANRLALAGVLAVFVGAVQLALGAFGLGGLTNLLSRPVLLGFTSAAAVLVLVNMVPGLLGLAPAGSSELGPVVRHLIREADGIHAPTVIVGGLVIAGVLVLERVRPSWPRAPLVLAAAALVVAFVPGFEGVRTIGVVPAALPGPALVVPTLDQLRTIAPHALTIAVVAYLEAHSIAKRFADAHGEPRPADQLVALGASNVAAGFLGGFPITAGLGRSAALVAAGARTRIAGLVTAGVVGIVVLVGGPVLATLPRAGLDAVVVTSLFALVDVAAAREVARIAPLDGVFLGLTFVATILLGFQWGVALGIGASVAAFLHATTAPHAAVLARIPGTHAYRNRERYPEAIPVERMLLVRIDAQLYFGNATFLRETMSELEDQAGAIDAIVLDASAVGSLDSSAAEALAKVVDDCESRGVAFALASVRGPVRDVLKRSGLWQRLGRGRLFLDVHSAVESLRPPDSSPRTVHALSPVL